MNRVGLRITGATNSGLTHVEGALTGRTYDAHSLIGLDPAGSKPPSQGCLGAPSP